MQNLVTIDLVQLRTLRELRERGTITATAAALHLTPSAVSQQVEAIKAELARFGDGQAGTVRLAAFGTAITGLAVPALRLLAAEHPGLSVTVEESDRRRRPAASTPRSAMAPRPLRTSPRYLPRSAPSPPGAASPTYGGRGGT